MSAMDKAYRETAEAVRTSNGGVDAARKLGIGGSTLRSRLPRMFREEYLTQEEWEDCINRGRRPNNPHSGEPAIPKSLEQRLRDEIAALKKDNKAMARELYQKEDWQTLLGSMNAPIEPKTFKLDLGTSSQGAGDIPVLFTSDFQWGEVIDLDEMDGLNSYNSQIASDRYRRLIERTVDLCKNHHTGAPPPAFYYLRGGDAISGEIHEELAETNDATSVPAVMDCCAHEEWGIQALADELDCPIIVVSVGGNHGRTTKKSRAKNYNDRNFETFLAWSLEKHFKSKNDERITFLTPKGPDALFDVYNTKFLLTHGDQVGARGGAGFTGPANTITRGMKKVVDYYSGQKTDIDVVLFGHFHTTLELEYGYSNGSLPGYSEYARSAMRARPQPPTQSLFHVNEKRGIVSYRKVFVGHKSEGRLC